MKKSMKLIPMDSTTKTVSIGIVYKTILLVLYFMLSGITLWSQQYLELNNDTLHLKQDLIRGGTISHISLSASDRNLVNIHDEGRYIQQSYFAGKDINRQADGQNPNWSPWCWNPIQAGDSYWNRAQILEQSSDGKNLYVKCIPMLWDMKNEPAEAEMEQWTTLMGNVVKVRNKITCMRTDDIWIEGYSRDQELPAVYPIASLNKLYSYFGSFPFTGAPLSKPEVVNISSGFWGRYPGGMVKENWMAFVDNTGWGMAVYTPICDDFIAGRAGGPIGEALDVSTSYISPVKQMIVNKNSVIEYEYYLVIGTLDQIRKEIYALKGIQANRWEFSDDLDGWSLNPKGGTLSREYGKLKFSANGTKPSVGKKVTDWSPDTLNNLWINLKNETAGDSAILRAFNANGDSLSIYIAMTPRDNEFRDYVVRLDTLPGWKSSGDFSLFKLIPTAEGETGDVSIDFIRFTENLMELSSYGNYREIIGLGNTLQLFARSIPSLNDLDVKWTLDQPSLASINGNGLLTSFGEGVVTVTATDKQDNKLTASLQIELIDDEQKTSWEFDRNLGGWEGNPHNAEVAHEKTWLKYTVLGDDPYVSNNVAPWAVNDLKYLWLNVKNETAGNGGTMYLFPEAGDFDFVDFPLKPNDTEFRDVFVDMRKAKKWTSKQVLNSLRLDANRGGEPGDLYFDFIRFREELVYVSSEGDVNEIKGLGSTLQLEAMLAIDLDYPVEFKWSVSDPSIASVDNMGLVTAKGEGQVMIKASDVDGKGIQGEISLLVRDVGTSVNNIAIEGLTLYPNPVGDQLYLLTAEKYPELSILSVNGVLVRKVRLKSMDGSIPVESLAPGVYLLRVNHQKDGVSYHRFVKK